MAVNTSDTINLDGENVIEFVVTIGDLLQLCPPVAYPPVPFTSEQEGLSKQYKNGFIILKPELGEFVGEDGDCVKYRHKKSGKQIIQFASQGLGEKYIYAVVAGITVHDHASIAQGGPAYATYYADVPTEEGS